jgi:hypothetical protein
LRRANRTCTLPPTQPRNRMQPTPTLVSVLLLLTVLPAQRNRGPRQAPTLTNYKFVEGTIDSAKVHNGTAGFLA